MAPIPNTDDDGARGRAVVVIVNSILEDRIAQVGEFMEAMSTLQLNAIDMDAIYDGVLPRSTAAIAVLGRIS